MYKNASLEDLLINQTNEQLVEIKHNTMDLMSEGLEHLRVRPKNQRNEWKSDDRGESIYKIDFCLYIACKKDIHD